MRTNNLLCLRLLILFFIATIGKTTNFVDDTAPLDRENTW